MQRIKQEKKVNIFDLVKQLRKQRMKMVQSFDQYALVYNAALEMTVRTKSPRGEFTHPRSLIIQSTLIFFQSSKTSLCTSRILNSSRNGLEEEETYEMRTRIEQRLMIKKVSCDLFYL